LFLADLLTGHGPSLTRPRRRGGTLSRRTGEGRGEGRFMGSRLRHTLNVRSYSVRLTAQEVSGIRSAILKEDPQARIFLFGSRTREDRRGGDVDILCLSGVTDRTVRRRMRVGLLKALGDQKIDLVLAPDDQSPFVRLILPEAIALA